MSVAKQVEARDLRQRVLTFLHKLSDRDTQAAAASELESIAKTLPSEALSPFLTSISATDSSDKSPVRRHCVRLISVLSEHHGNSLSPYLSKILTAVSCRLRDPDSSVRSACVAASFSLASHLTSLPFSSIAKPFLELLFTEQERNAQNGAALCLAAVIEGSSNPDAGSLRRILSRLEKLAKCNNCKARGAVLALIASIVGVKGVLSGGAGKKILIRNLVLCSVNLLRSDDWASRKAAADVLIKIAAMEKEAVSEFKPSCLKTFEANKFDKVKAVRETMNQMIEVWKEIPDLTDDFSPSPESGGSSKENTSDQRYPLGSKTSIGSSAPQIKKGSHLVSNEDKKGLALFRKLDRKKPSEQKTEVSTPVGSVGSRIFKNKHFHGGGRGPTNEEEKIHLSKPEVKRALFNENYENLKPCVFKNSSPVVPCGEASVVVSNETGEICRNQRDSEEISIIRKQLFQIETQQSNLLDLLQRYIEGSQNSMHSLESRVHGLELSLDEISFDLAVSTGRMSQNKGALCCKLPGTLFLSSKLWRKTVRSSTSSLSTSSYGTTSVGSNPNKHRGTKGFLLQNRRNRFQSGHGLIMNPLAQLPRGAQGLPEASYNGVVKNVPEASRLRHRYEERAEHVLTCER